MNSYQPYQNVQQPMVQQPIMQQPVMQQPIQAAHNYVVQNPQNQYSQNQYSQYQPYPQFKRKFDTVQGEIAANVYPVDIGEEVILMDIDNPYIYKKRRGFDGKLETEKDVIMRYEEEAHDDAPDYIRRDEVDMMIQNAVQNAVEQKMSEMQPKRKTKAED